jgi:hypothetical protein
MVFSFLNFKINFLPFHSGLMVNIIGGIYLRAHFMARTLLTLRNYINKKRELIKYYRLLVEFGITFADP